MGQLEKLPMRRLSRETAAVLKMLKNTRKSMIVTHFGEPVALLTPVTDQWGTPAAAIESHPMVDDGEEYTDTQKTVIRLIETGVTHPDRIAAATGLEPREVSIALGQCELKGAIVKKPWGYVPRTKN